MAPVLPRGKLRRSEVKWLAQGHTASSGVRIQTQEAELQSAGCNDKAMPRLWLCPAAPQRHRAVHSQPPPQRLGRGQRSAVSSPEPWVAQRCQYLCLTIIYHPSNWEHICHTCGTGNPAHLKCCVTCEGALPSSQEVG